MQVTFEIFFRDLTKEAQAELLRLFHTTEEAENWEVFPLAMIDREEDEEE